MAVTTTFALAEPPPVRLRAPPRGSRPPNAGAQPFFVSPPAGIP